MVGQNTGELAAVEHREDGAEAPSVVSVTDRDWLAEQERLEEQVWAQPIPLGIYHSVDCSHYVHAMRQTIATERNRIEQGQRWDREAYGMHPLLETDDVEADFSAAYERFLEQLAYAERKNALDLIERAQTDATILERAARQVMLERAGFMNDMVSLDVLDLPDDDPTRNRWLQSREYAVASEELRPIVDAEREACLAALATRHEKQLITDSEYDAQQRDVTAYYDEAYLQHLAIERIQMYRYAVDLVWCVRREQATDNVSLALLGYL